jgi:hypothetical protein
MPNASRITASTPISAPKTTVTTRVMKMMRLPVAFGLMYVK